MAIVHLSKDNFKEEVLESKVPVLVDFWATWCGPCQTMGPLVEEIAEERADIKVCKLDVDQEPELARQYRVMSIPTFLVFKESRSFPVKISCTVTGTSRKAFPVIGMMCDLKTFSHASEEYRMAAWNITCTERMIADCSRFTWRFSLASVDGNVA